MIELSKDATPLELQAVSLPNTVVEAGAVRRSCCLSTAQSWPAHPLSNAAAFAVTSVAHLQHPHMSKTSRRQQMHVPGASMGQPSTTHCQVQQMLRLQVQAAQHEEPASLHTAGTVLQLFKHKKHCC